MRDRQLERNISRLEAFVQRWATLSQFLERAFQGSAFTPEDEAAFLQLKSQLAQEHEVLMTNLLTPSEREDRALRLLNLMPSLEALKDLPEGMPKKIATDWHSCYMAFQAWLGRLKGRQAQLAAISSFQTAAKRVFTNPFLIVLLCVAAGYGIYRFADEWVPKLMQLIETTEKKP
jgi:hypothetical protein